jgi:hypothetical protein
MKRRIALLAATVALVVPAAVSAAPAPPVYGEPNCAGHYRAYLIAQVNDIDAYDNGLAGVAKAFGWSVKQLQDAIEAACG